jgi:hypothetical protein
MDRLPMWKATLKRSFLGASQFLFFHKLFAYAHGGLRAVRRMLRAIPTFRLKDGAKPAFWLGRPHPS